MPYYRIGYTTNFAGCDEEIIVFSDADLTEDDIYEWAAEQIQVSPICDEVEFDDLEDWEQESIEPW